MSIPAYPLSWPEGWRRTQPEKRAIGRFATKQRGGTKALTVAESVDRVLDQLDAIQSRDVIISTNIEPTLGGRPRSSQAEPANPGAAVYWTTAQGQTRCMAIDRYTRVADNLAAIAATLEAMRAIERHGGAEVMDRAFTGFAALPAPRAWWQVFHLDGPCSLEEAEHYYRQLAKLRHPDVPGGSAEAMAELNDAIDQARAYHQGGKG